MNCPFCTTILPDDARFCSGCGRMIELPEQPRIPDSLLPVKEAAPEAPAPAPAEAQPVPAPEECPAENPAPAREEIPAENPAPAAPEEEPTREPAASAPVEAPVPEVPQEKPRLLKPLLVPLIALSVIFLFGLGCYFLLPDPPAEQLPPETTAPSIQDPDKPPLPSEKQEDYDNDGLRDESFVPAPDRCFLVTEEGIVFLPQMYTGGPVLVIPNEIIGEPVTAIAPGGFAEMKDITTVILPDCLETIGVEAFRDCPELRGMYIPESVRSIGQNAFANCKSLESVSISASMETIETGAFSGCSALRYFFYSGTFQQWQALYYEYVNPFAYACCADGDYYHGVNLP